MITAVEPRPGSAAAPPSADAVVRITRLTKRFPARRSLRQTLRHPRQVEYRTALDDISLEVRRGEFFGLLGSNGAGKTTLFKILSTLVLPDEGSASVEGHDVVREPAAVRRRLTPVIADERSLLWRLTARENLRLYASLHGLRGRTADVRVDELLVAVGLHEAGTKMVGQFSSGMKQRLLIARALVARPDVLLLDEPTRSLDPVSAREFRRMLREEIAREHGCTVLLATHHAEEALHLCDRVGILHRGALVAVGPADELARASGEDGYRLLTTQPEHPLLDDLVRTGAILACTPGPVREDGWAPVDLRVDGGPDDAARVLARLVRAGVPVASFERVPLSLADLIERVVASRRSSDV